MNTLSRLPQSKGFWLTMVILCVALESIALFYQYQLNYLPCVLCIHVRMLLAGILLISILGWVFASIRAIGLALFVLLTGFWLWMSERSYQLLGVERGWIFGECDMSSGLPEWLALEKWFPWLFEIFEPCGYTPFLLFRISMAEALIVMSIVFSLLLLASLALQFKSGIRKLASAQ